MDVTVGNVAWIDGRVGTNPSSDAISFRPQSDVPTVQFRTAVPTSAGGIHRNFLVASFPGSEGHNDRKLTIQWRVVSPDLDPTSGDDAGSRTRLAWFVQVFHANDFFEHEATVIRTRPPFSSERTTLYGAPWYRALYEGVIEGRPSGMGVYEGAIQIPGGALFPSPAYFMKATPFRLVVKEGPLPCPLDGTHTIPANREDCLFCRGSVRRRYGEPIDRFDLKVSGVTVETLLGTARWIVRRDGPAAALTPDAMRRLADGFLNWASTRPGGLAALQGTFGGGAYLDGTTFMIGGMSSLWMDRPAPAGLGGDRKKSEERITWSVWRSLAGTDVVALFAPNAMLADLMMENTPWTPGTWRLPASGDSGAGDGRLFDGLWVDVVRRDAARRGASWTQLPFWDGAGGSGSGGPVSGDALSVLKPVGSGRMRIRTDDATPPPGGVSARTTHLRTVEKNEADGLVDETDRARIWTAVKIAATVADDHPSAIFLSDGINVTSCLAEGDAVGALLCSLSGGAKASKTLLSSFLFKGHPLQGSLWAKGLDVPVLKSRTFASAGSAVNVAGAVAGALETVYWIYRYNRATDPLVKQEAARQTIAVAIDTGIGVMPQGSLILIPWTVSAIVTQQILRELGFGLSPLAEKMVTPGQSLTTLALHLLPKSVSKEEADMVAELAQKDAIDRCTRYNRDPARKATYIYIPPGY